MKVLIVLLSSFTAVTAFADGVCSYGHAGLFSSYDYHRVAVSKESCLKMAADAIVPTDSRDFKVKVKFSTCPEAEGKCEITYKEVMKYSELQAHANL